MIKIKKISIKQFGILKDFELDLGNYGLTILHGNNESGKTMILDAILEALFLIKRINSNLSEQGNNAILEEALNNKASNSGIIRFNNHENSFNGTVELDIDNSVIIFPQKEPLDKVLSIPLIFAKNMLVVREGELHFNYADNWWSSVKNRISGFSGDYGKIVNQVMESVGVTIDGESIKKSGQSVDDQYETLDKKLKALQAAKTDIKEFETLAVRQTETDNLLKKCQEKLNDLQRAQKAVCYNEGMKLVARYNETKIKCLEFDKYKKDNLKIWRNTENEIIKAKQVIEISKQYKDNFSKTLNKNYSDIEDWKKKVSEWEKRERDVIPPLESKLIDYKQKQTGLLRGSSGKSMMSVWIILCIVFALGVTFISLEINPVFFPVAGILYIAFGISLKMWFSSRNIGSQLESSGRVIKEMFKLIETGSENENMSVNEINNWLIGNRNLHNELKKKSKQTAGKDLPDLNNLTKEISASVQSLDNKLQKLESFTKALKVSTECDSYDDLQLKCNEKEAVHVNLKMLTEQINRLLGAVVEAEWERKLQELKPGETVELEWDEHYANRLEAQIAKLNEQLKTINDKMVEIKINTAKLDCRTLEDLWIKEDEIKSELVGIRIDKEAATVAAEIIEKVSQEQDSIINDIISNNDNSASNIFSVITGDRYKKIFVDKNRISADTYSGYKLPIEMLSAGTKAQLYFALRINLAQKLINRKSAFLLLDDPFLVCDDKRTIEMVKMLLETREKGWQLIYFTIDNSLIETFKNYFKDDLNVIQLPALLAV